MIYINKDTLDPRAACVRTCVCGFCGAGESAEWQECFLTPWPDHRGRDCLQTLASRIPAKSSPPAQPGRPARPARGQQHPPPCAPLAPAPALLAALRVGVRCGLCLEADVIPTPYSAVFPGETAGQVFLFFAGVGNGEDDSTRPPIPANTHTHAHTPMLPRRVKKKKCNPTEL